MDSVYNDPAIDAQSANDWSSLVSGVLGKWADAEIRHRYEPKSTTQSGTTPTGENFQLGVPNLRIGQTVVNGWLVLAGAAVAAVVLWRVLD